MHRGKNGGAYGHRPTLVFSFSNHLNKALTKKAQRLKNIWNKSKGDALIKHIYGNECPEKIKSQTKNFSS